MCVRSVSGTKVWIAPSAVDLRTKIPLLSIAKLDFGGSACKAAV